MSLRIDLGCAPYYKFRKTLVFLFSPMTMEIINGLNTNLINYTKEV